MQPGQAVRLALQTWLNYAQFSSNVEYLKLVASIAIQVPCLVLISLPEQHTRKGHMYKLVPMQQHQGNGPPFRLHHSRRIHLTVAAQVACEVGNLPHPLCLLSARCTIKASLIPKPPPHPQRRLRLPHLQAAQTCGCDLHITASKSCPQHRQPRPFHQPSGSSAATLMMKAELLSPPFRHQVLGSFLPKEKELFSKVLC